MRSRFARALSPLNREDTDKWTLTIVHSVSNGRLYMYMRSQYMFLEVLTYLMTFHEDIQTYTQINRFVCVSVFFSREFVHTWMPT